MPESVQPQPMAEPSRISRSSVAVVPAVNPRGCITCTPGGARHTADFELRYRRGALRVAIPVCDTSLPAELARLLSGDVTADADNTANAGELPPVRLLRVASEDAP